MNNFSITSLIKSEKLSLENFAPFAVSRVDKIAACAKIIING
jgi:hypothetical protein